MGSTVKISSDQRYILRMNQFLISVQHMISLVFLEIWVAFKAFLYLYWESQLFRCLHIVSTSRLLENFSWQDLLNQISFQIFLMIKKVNCLMRILFAPNQRKCRKKLGSITFLKLACMIALCYSIQLGLEDWAKLVDAKLISFVADLVSPNEESLRSYMMQQLIDLMKRPILLRL